jgi:hypothetical protein
MKKLTSLQILMLMNLALGSSHMYGEHPSNMDDLNEAIQLELKFAQDETIEVLNDLAASQPMVIEHIIQDEADLEATFNSIRAFINKKNKEIEKLLKEKVVAEAEVAKLAVELADAQAMLEKAIAKQRAKHKHNHKYEQAIKDALMKAEQGVKALNKKAVNFFSNTGKAISKGAKNIKKSKASKAVVKASSQASEAIEYQAANAARYIPGVQNQVAKNLAEKRNISTEEANNIINAAFASDQMNDEAMNDQAMMENNMNDQADAIVDQMDDQAIIADDSSQPSDEVVVQATKQKKKKSKK